MATNLDIEKAIKRITERGAGYKLYTDYYYGLHRQAYMSQEYLNDYGAMFRDLRLNMCPRVVDALVDRLSITGFGVEDDGKKEQPELPQAVPPQAPQGAPTDTLAPATPSEAVPIPETEGDKAWEVWLQNRMDRRAGEAHVEAAKSGDAYLIVWPSKDDPQRPVIYVNKGAIMTVYYDEEEPGRIMWAAKVWLTDEKFTRVTLYYPDRIEKYISANKNQGNTPTKAAAYSTYEPTVINTFGKVPVFHLANNAGCGEMGFSELKDVVALQDALNKSYLDLMVEGEFDAFRQRWITGLDIETDADSGKPKRLFRPGRDKIWAVDNPETKFGEFQAGDPTKTLDVITAHIMHIARVSATPLHYMNLMSGDFPSGAAMRTAESPFIAKIEDRQVAWGNVWEDVMKFALQIQGVEVERLSTQWKPAAVKSRKEAIEEATALLAMGIPEEQVWKELDYSEADIAEWLAQKEKRKAEMQAKMAVSVAQPGQGVAPESNPPPTGEKGPNVASDMGMPSREVA